jgi:hypothetical protein
MGVGPQDEITAGDNQGNWIPTSKINWVRKGGFNGYVPHSGGKGQPKDFDPPLCWIPYALDNSSGGQVWATSDRWGPLQGHLLHLSYGKSSLFYAVTQEVGNVMQGGVVRLPLTFDTGIMRGRFNPKDGQLYVCGLRGWQTNGVRDGGLFRVRYTGKRFSDPISLEVTRTGVKLGFASPLEPGSVTLDGFAAEQWNYRWTAGYGSPEFSVLHPDRKGRDPVGIADAKLSADGKTVVLEIPDLRPVQQMCIKMRLRAADGTPISTELNSTVHRLP